MVLFYGSYQPNDALYALGKAVSGQEQISEISGEMMISQENTSPQRIQSKILIAYFTWADNTVVEDQEAAVESAMAHYEAMGDAALYGADAISSASVVVPGNTARLGEWIQQETGGDLFSIQVKDPYPSDYEECMDRASREDAENVRPELTGSVEAFSDYDVIFLGFPNWWSSLPMPVLSFVEQYNFSGKTVVPFCAHGTGGLSATVRDLKAALPDSAAVLDPLGVYRADIMEAQPQVQNWLKELGFTE
ncbi:MAG: flavodoxin [Clostridiales bacterium]|nr:flavodoxin [Clostridiales bacterium]